MVKELVIDKIVMQSKHKEMDKIVTGQELEQYEECSRSQLNNLSERELQDLCNKYLCYKGYDLQFKLIDVQYSHTSTPSSHKRTTVSSSRKHNTREHSFHGCTPNTTTNDDSSSKLRSSSIKKAYMTRINAQEAINPTEEKVIEEMFSRYLYHNGYNFERQKPLKVGVLDLLIHHSDNRKEIVEVKQQTMTLDLACALGQTLFYSYGVKEVFGDVKIDKTVLLVHNKTWSSFADIFVNEGVNVLLYGQGELISHSHYLENTDLTRYADL